jgi:hypothetical protein
MNATLIKSLVALVPAAVLLVFSITLWLRERSIATRLEVSGSACLVVVILTHVSEATHLLPGMHFGDPHSVGHYLDLSCAVLGVGLFPVGYVLHAKTKRPR